MKRHLFLPLLTAACLLLALPVKAQNMAATVLTPPCSNNGQIGVTVTGLTPPITYIYTNPAANITITHTGINSLSDNLTGISAYQQLNNWLNPNLWTVSASDGTNNTFATVNMPVPITDTVTVNTAACPALSGVQAWHVSGGTPPFTYVWTNLGTNLTYMSNPATVPNGDYHLTITDANGCSVISAGTGTAVIQVKSSTNILVNVSGTAANCTNGTAIANHSGGTGPFTYLWSNGATSQNISGLASGNYNCTVTDALGCQASGSYYVPQAVNLNFNSSVTNATCLQNNGSILGFVNGGTAPYSFLWSNGATAQNPTSLTGGQTYNVLITDAIGCKGMGSVYVGVNTPVVATYSSSPSTCTTATGSATLSITGGTPPYSIVWSTLPNVSTAVVSGLAPGYYPFTITDANGCTRTGIIPIAPNTVINATMGSTAAICPATTGSLKLAVSGSNGPFTYLWSNGATASSILNVPAGYYTCLITDATGCSVSRGGAISKTSPVQVAYNTTPASCIFATDGAITANGLGGTPPYTYSWGNGQTGPTLSGLKQGVYYVAVTDANGCKSSQGCVTVGYNAANTSCYCTITGSVYADANINCVLNNGETGLPNIQVQCSNNGFAYTSATGAYSFIVPTGTYSITEIVHPFFPLAQCQNNTQVVNVTAGNNCVSVVNFANVILPAHDLRLITSNLIPPVPGNTYSQKIIVMNEGTLPEPTIKFGYTHDGQLNYTNCTPWALAQPNAVNSPNWFRTSSFPNLSSTPFTSAIVNYFVPTNVPMGTQVTFMDSVSSAAPISTSWLSDYSPWNNVNFVKATVVAGYDPNFKEVFPQGDGPQGNITHADSNLTYIIHFQNTGTYFAQNIFLLDTLDPSLDIKTLRPGYSDHKFTTSISENGVLRFDFKNINLPWKSGYGDAQSSGMVTYSVKMKRKLPLGTKIKNTAAIYFDYNEPVITNTTINTLVAPVSVKELSGYAARLSIFPNPAGDHFTLTFESPESTSAVLSILDVSGRQIISKTVQVTKGHNQLTQDNAMLQNGVYFIQLHTSEGSVTTKMVISK